MFGMYDFHYANQIQFHFLWLQIKFNGEIVRYSTLKKERSKNPM